MFRKFGVEIEVVGISQQQALNALRCVGINASIENYNHTTRSHWKLVTDASVRNGFEVVSPVLQGSNGLDQVNTVAQALDDAGAGVNVNCGLHVHFDASGLSVDDVRNIVTRYAKYESKIDAFMPNSRRGDNNIYCKSIRGLAPRLARATTVQSLARLQNGRYFKVNLQSFLCHGTIEFRQHSGTVNPAKICNWIEFLDSFIESSKTTVVTAVPVVDSPLKGVQKKFAEMLTENETVTLATICDTFGWQAHSARSAVTRLRQAGLNIKAVRVQGESAYKLLNGMAIQPSRTAQADNLWNGVAERIVRFYRNRAAVLAAV